MRAPGNLIGAELNRAEDGSLETETATLARGQLRCPHAASLSSLRRASGLGFGSSVQPGGILLAAAERARSERNVRQFGNAVSRRPERDHLLGGEGLKVAIVEIPSAFSTVPGSP